MHSPDESPSKPQALGSQIRTSRSLGNLTHLKRQCERLIYRTLAEVFDLAFQSTGI